MRYALTKSTRTATGLHRDDPAPVHDECDAPLRHLREDLWLCTGCSKSGRLLLTPAEDLPSRPTARDEMRTRWRDLPSPAPFPPPPTYPGEWQRYFDHCFPAGLLMMTAHDDAEHTVREDALVVVAARVIVADDCPDYADLVVSDIYIDRPHYLNGVVKVERVAPGVLAVANGEGRWIRLDGHLRQEEKRAVEARRRGGYFGLYEMTPLSGRKARSRYE